MTDEISELRKALIACHEAMDELNNEMGEGNKLCLFCKAQDWDGTGIIHVSGCPLIDARKVLRGNND